jgi:hypothetical protein
VDLQKARISLKAAFGHLTETPRNLDLDICRMETLEDPGIELRALEVNLFAAMLQH